MTTTSAAELLKQILALQAEGRDLNKIGLVITDGDRDGMVAEWVTDEEDEYENGASALTVVGGLQ